MRVNVNDPLGCLYVYAEQRRRSSKDRVDVKNAKLTGKQRRRPRLALDERGNRSSRQSLRNDLGHRLREAREQKKIGLRELARRLGVSASLISQIETGKTEPSINTLFAIVSELELSVNEIVFDSKQDAGLPSGTAAPQAQNGEVVSRRTGESRPSRRTRVTRPAQHEPNIDQPRVRCQLAAAHGAARSQRRLPLPPLSAGERVDSSSFPDEA